MSNFNIEQYFINRKIEYRSSGKNVSRGEYSICCPFCSEDKFHCGINPEKGVFNCWICSQKGDIAKLLSKLLGISYIEAKEIINPISDLKKALEERDIKNIKIIEINKQKSFKLPEYVYPFKKGSINIWQEIGHDFLVEKYNLMWEYILDAKLHYCINGRYKNSIIIPFYFNGELVNFISRTWDTNAKKRYDNCPNELSLVNTKKILYNYDSVIGKQQIIVVEGCFDAIKVGLDRAVAVCGTEVSQEQKNLLAKLKTDELIIMFDNDPHLKTTSKKAQDLVDYLSPFVKTRLIKLPYGKDPGEMERGEIDYLIGGTHESIRT